MPDPQTHSQLPTPITQTERLLTVAEFHRLADVPPEIEWFANRSTRRVYENAIQDFMRFTGIVWPEEFRTATRAHVIAWRRPRAARARRQHGPVSPGALVVVRIFVREERRHP
jgi:hypothetical protein